MSEPRAGRPEMPGYGIVGENEGDGLLAWSWAAERLAAAKTYFLSTVRADRRPHVMVVWGLWLDDSFLFSTGRGSRKAKNLAANPHCVVCPDGAEEAIVVEGSAEEASDPELLARYAAAYLAKYRVDVAGGTDPVFRVRPRLVHGLIEKSFTRSATQWRF
jgi:hypothetical protein